MGCMNLGRAGLREATEKGDCVDAFLPCLQLPSITAQRILLLRTCQGLEARPKIAHSSPQRIRALLAAARRSPSLSPPSPR